MRWRRGRGASWWVGNRRHAAAGAGRCTRCPGRRGASCRPRCWARCRGCCEAAAAFAATSFRQRSRAAPARGGRQGIEEGGVGVGRISSALWQGAFQGRSRRTWIVLWAALRESREQRPPMDSGKSSSRFQERSRRVRLVRDPKSVGRVSKSFKDRSRNLRAARSHKAPGSAVSLLFARLSMRRALPMLLIVSGSSSISLLRASSFARSRQKPSALGKVRSELPCSSITRREDSSRTSSCRRGGVREGGSVVGPSPPVGGRTGRWVRWFRERSRRSSEDSG